MPIGRSLRGLRKGPRFSYSPVAMSSRMICEPSEFFTQTLPSTFDAATEKCDCCVASRCHSFGIGYMRKISVAIEARKPGLIHEPDPDIAVLIDFEVEGTFGMIRL